MSDEKPNSIPQIPPEVPINFIKGNHFRVIHASGVWFGTDPQGNLHLTFYNERTAIPQKIVININQQTGQFTGEDASKRESKEGLVRELEFDVILSLAVATEIAQKFQENVSNATKAQELAKRAESS